METSLKIAVEKVLNGQIVCHKMPYVIGEYEQTELKEGRTIFNCFERYRDPIFNDSDDERCLHYHLGSIITEYVGMIRRYLSLDSIDKYCIEILVTKISDNDNKYTLDKELYKEKEK